MENNPTEENLIELTKPVKVKNRDKKKQLTKKASGEENNINKSSKISNIDKTNAAAKHNSLDGGVDADQE